MDNLPGYEVLSRMTDQELQNVFGVRDFFAYELDFASVAAAGTASASFTVQTDSNFLWQYGCFFADIAGAVQTDSSRVIPLITATIQDQSSGRNLTSAAVPIASLFGNGSLPFLLPTPRFFRAATQVTVAITNFSAATAYVLKLQFIGTKFFKFAQTL